MSALHKVHLMRYHTPAFHLFCLTWDNVYSGANLIALLSERRRTRWTLVLGAVISCDFHGHRKEYATGFVNTDLSYNGLASAITQSTESVNANLN